MAPLDPPLGPPWDFRAFQKPSFFIRFLTVFAIGRSCLELRLSCPMLCYLSFISGPLGAILGPSWAPLWPSCALQASPWGHLGLSLDFPRTPWDHLGPSWAHLGPTWSLWGTFWALLGTLLGPFGAMLALGWGHLGNVCLSLSFSSLPVQNKRLGLEASSTRGASAGTRSAYNIALTRWCT